MSPLLEAGLYGLAGGASLLVGAAAAFLFHPGPRAIGLIMGFGAGALISAVSFELTEESYALAGGDTLVLGLAAGAATFFAADWYIDARGGEHRKRAAGNQADGSPQAIVLGTVLDGVPESLALGIGLAGPREVGVTLLVGVMLSNFPESLGATTGLRRAGYSQKSVVGLWALVVVVSVVAAVAGFELLGDTSDSVAGFVQAFAAGAILTMLADTMMPDAFEHGGRVVGLLTVLGFASAFLVSTL